MPIRRHGHSLLPRGLIVEDLEIGAADIVAVAR
jgi:hypothetical protein